jgi:large subunit ribosomal protein L19
MKAVLEGVQISPVNMEERRSLGIKAGDTVRVHQKIQDKDKTRIQVFEGTVLARKHGDEPGATFTVRKVASGVGVEKIFPLYSPLIDKLEIVKRAKVRRAKLYFIREKVAREVKRQMRRMSMVAMATESGAEAAVREAEEAKQAEAEAESAKATEVEEATSAVEQEATPEPTPEVSNDTTVEEGETPTAESNKEEVEEAEEEVNEEAEVTDTEKKD